MKTQPRRPRSGNGSADQNIALFDLSLRLEKEVWKLSPPRLHHCEAAWKWNPPPLADFDFWLVLKGRGSLNVGRRDFPLVAGRWFLLQPGDQPAASHDPKHPLQVFACHFSPPGMTRLTEDVLSGLSPDPPQLEAEKTTKVFREGPTGRALATALLRQMILQEIHSGTRQPTDGRNRLDDLALAVRSSPGRDWNITAMARQCGLSVPHFNRLWRTACGMAPGRYIIHHRIRRAAELLRESNLSIQQIADTLGYRDVFFFHRQFRRFAGATPRAVRLGERSRLDDLQEKL